MSQFLETWSQFLNVTYQNNFGVEIVFVESEEAPSRGPAPRVVWPSSSIETPLRTRLQFFSPDDESAPPNIIHLSARASNSGRVDDNCIALGYEQIILGGNKIGWLGKHEVVLNYHPNLIEFNDTLEFNPQKEFLSRLEPIILGLIQIPEGSARSVKLFSAHFAPEDISDEVGKKWSAICSTRVNRIKSEITNAHMVIEGLFSDISEMMAGIHKNNSAIYALEGISSKDFSRESKNWMKAMNTDGMRFDIDGTHIVVRVPKFVLRENLVIGPFIVRIDVCNLSDCKVLAPDSVDIFHSKEGYYHPHVNRDGIVCWGSFRTEAASMHLNANPFEFMIVLMNILRYSYDEHGAYDPSGWKIAILKSRDGDGAVDAGADGDEEECDHCDSGHSPNDDCPNYCANCQEYVDWDYHSICDEHDVCYGDGEECYRCQEEAEEEERREEEREQAERDEAEEAERLENEALDAADAATTATAESESTDAEAGGTVTSTVSSDE